MVMTLLQRMHQQQIEADAISYTSALSAGSISGRFENGGKRVGFEVDLLVHLGGFKNK